MVIKGYHFNVFVNLLYRAQELKDSFKIPIEDDTNDYEDVMETPPPPPPPFPATGLSQLNGVHGQLTMSANHMTNETVTLSHENVDRTRDLGDVSPPQYSTIKKDKPKESFSSETRRGSSPVIKSHYMSTSTAITEEFNRLTKELESSLTGQH